MGIINSKQTIKGNINSNHIFGTITNVASKETDIPAYMDDYEITPLVREEQVLETRGKRMIKDVHVKEVPYFEVSNIENGTTIYIGKDA